MSATGGGTRRAKRCANAIWIVCSSAVGRRSGTSTFANARYLCPIGGNSTHNLLIFPREGEPTALIFFTTFLDGWLRAQHWVSDVRSRQGPWADSVVARLKEMGLERARIGVDGLAGPLDPDGWLPHSMYLRMTELLPDATFVNIDGMLESLRAIKSPEEISVLDQAARLGDAMMRAARTSARPGTRECEVYADMMRAMIAGGGEVPTLFLWEAGPRPSTHPFALPAQRKLERGDLIICEIHPKYGGYTTHIERTFCLGEPDANYRRIYDGCLAAYETGMAHFGPGRGIKAALDAVARTIAERGLRVCETGIHGHGLGSLEFPRYRLHALKADQRALAEMGDRFVPGMVFAFNIDLFDPTFHDGKTGTVFAETIAITDTGARRLHSYDTALQILDI
jgi:Xaa-Pro dipeptidase